MDFGQFCKDNDNNEKLTITIKPYDAIGMWNVFSGHFLSWPHFASSVGCELPVIDILIAV